MRKTMYIMSIMLVSLFVSAGSGSDGKPEDVTKAEEQVSAPLTDGVMEPLNEMIEERLATTNAKEYEMNLVLEETAIKVWHRAPYAFDEIGRVDVDEPLGQYSDDKLKEYTDENFQAEIEYCCGYYGAAREPNLIQVVRIYKDDQLYGMDYEVWTNSEKNAVVEFHWNFFMDADDFVTRIDENENYYE